MAERGIIFSTPMVQAILAGRKTQTRRILTLKNCTPGSATKKHHLFDFDRGFPDPGLGAGGYLKVPHCHKEDGWESDPASDMITRMRGPWRIGDLLWVRETWATSSIYDHLPPRDIPENGILWWQSEGEKPSHFGKTRPSIFMPKWAARIWLEITGVRVERLNALSAEDAWAEGVKTNPNHRYKTDAGSRIEFRKLWKSIHGADAWDKNPWVWVVEFRRVDQ